MRRKEYLPEGQGPLFPDGQPLSALKSAMEQQTVLEAVATRCSRDQNLTVSLGGYSGVIPRDEAVHPAISGSKRDIAILSRVGKPTCAVISAIDIDGGGKPHLTLSRRRAQELAMAWLLENAQPGSVLPARVTHLAPFGAFVDLGCGIVSLIPLENISFSRISHPGCRFRVGQDILVLVQSIDRNTCRFYLSHRELLGTWLENAAGFAPHETVTGIVRSIRDYGIFIELTPNLSGLAEWRSDLREGEKLAVYIKSIRPEERKIKLQVIQSLGPAEEPAPFTYRITDGIVENWQY